MVVTKAMLSAGVASTRLSHRGALFSGTMLVLLYCLLEIPVAGNSYFKSRFFVALRELDLPDEEEIVRGEIRVAARLSMGLEYLRLFFTDRRIIVAHIGKRGAGSQATISFFGKLSSAVEDLFKSGRESVTKRMVWGSAPESILAKDKDNFSLSYSHIVEVTLDEKFVHPKLTVLTTDDKYQFIVHGLRDDLRELLRKTLGTKFRTI